MNFLYSLNLIWVIYFAVPLMRYSVTNLFLIVEYGESDEKFFISEVKNGSTDAFLTVNFAISLAILVVQIAMVSYMYYNLNENSPLLNPFDSQRDTLYHSMDCPESCSGN